MDLRWLFFVSACFLIQQEIRSQNCNDIADTTNCPYIADGTCDAGNFCPSNSDCFDCDTCQQMNGNCEMCAQSGCVYCPSDGLCLTQPINEQVWKSVILQNPATSRLPACLSESDWTTSCTVPPDSPYSDPLYSSQEWVFDMMNVQSVWEQGITGKGVVVRINDPEGIDINHPDLAANFNLEMSCDDHLPPNISSNVHGTAVAAIAVASGNNGVCSVGVAPDATLSACRGPTALTDENVAAFLDQELPTTHISVNSWNFDSCAKKLVHDRRRFLQQLTCPFVEPTNLNPCRECVYLSDAECEEYIVQYCTTRYEKEYPGCAEFLDLFVVCGYNVLSDVGQAAITRGIKSGRDGLGIIYIFAAGNEYNRYENVNTEGWLNTRFTIVVGAVGKDGKHASYSSEGAAVFVTGPGGDKDTFGNHWTAMAGGGCSNAQYGTSYSAPAVAGGIALMLEANPKLTWRDVQGIIASTSRVVDQDHPSWVTNGARIKHSNLYGFGIFDARAAVAAANVWLNFGPEKQVIAESGTINLGIADDATQRATTKVVIDESQAITVESVVVYLQLEHSSRGDLEIILTSPRGTPSILHPAKRPEKQQLSGEERWKLMTVANYGEALNGDWTLTLADKRTGNLGDCADLGKFEYHLEEEDGIIKVTDCEVLEFGGSCSNGQVLRSGVANLRDNNGALATDICCACGGGTPVSTANILRSWRLVVYGHETLSSEEGRNMGAPNGNIGTESESSGAVVKVPELLSTKLVLNGFLSVVFLGWIL